MNKRVNTSVYTREYYLNSCLGYEEFKKNPGHSIPERTKKLLNDLGLRPGMRILDIGCGRGDVCFYLSRRGIKCFGVDYSHDAIKLANQMLGKQTNSIKKNILFKVMDAKMLNFKNNYFDIVVSIDLFEHLYKYELEIVLMEIKRVLKKNGVLAVHTEPNVIYLNFTHKYYVFPVSEFLIKINKFFTGKNYPGMPKDPRNDLHKRQHVNEPTYFYLKRLLNSCGFEGKIHQIVPFKPIISWKDFVFNIIVWLCPLSLFVPFTYLFSYDYVCILKNRK